VRKLERKKKNKKNFQSPLHTLKPRSYRRCRGFGRSEGEFKILKFAESGKKKKSEQNRSPARKKLVKDENVRGPFWWRCVCGITDCVVSLEPVHRYVRIGFLNLTSLVVRGL
jgi:hypothetical protein